MANQLPARTGLTRRLVAVAATAAAAAIALSACSVGQDAQTVNQKPPIDAASATVGDLAIRSAAVVSDSSGSDSGAGSYAKGGTALLQFVVINTGPSSVTLTSVSTPAATSAVISQAGPNGVSGSIAGDGASASASDSASASGSDAGSASASAGGSGSASASASGSASASASASGSASSGASSPAAGSSAPATSSSTPIEIGAGQTVQIGFSPDGANVRLTGLTAPLYPAQTVPVTFSFSDGSGQGAITRTIDASLPVQLNSNPPSAPVVSDATEPAGD